MELSTIACSYLNRVLNPYHNIHRFAYFPQILLDYKCSTPLSSCITRWSIKPHDFFLLQIAKITVSGNYLARFLRFGMGNFHYGDLQGAKIPLGHLLHRIPLLFLYIWLQYMLYCINCVRAECGIMLCDNICSHLH